MAEVLLRIRARLSAMFWPCPAVGIQPATCMHSQVDGLFLTKRKPVFCQGFLCRRSAPLERARENLIYLFAWSGQSRRHPRRFARWALILSPWIYQVRRGTLRHRCERYGVFQAIGRCQEARSLSIIRMTQPRPIFAWPHARAIVRSNTLNVIRPSGLGLTRASSVTLMAWRYWRMRLVRVRVRSVPPPIDPITLRLLSGPSPAVLWARSCSTRFDGHRCMSGTLRMERPLKTSASGKDRGTTRFLERTGKRRCPGSGWPLATAWAYSTRRRLARSRLPVVMLPNCWIVSTPTPGSRCRSGAVVMV